MENNNLLKVIKILKETTDKLYDELFKEPYSKPDEERSKGGSTKEKGIGISCKFCDRSIEAFEEFYIHEEVLYTDNAYIVNKYLCPTCYKDIKSTGIKPPFIKMKKQ